MLPVSKSNKYDTKYIFVSFNHEIIKIKTHVWKWVSRLLEGVLNIVDFDLGYEPEDYIYDEVRSDEFEQITSGTRGCANPFSSKLVETVNIQNNVTISWYWSAKR